MPRCISYAHGGLKLTAIVSVIRERLIPEGFQTIVLQLNTASLPGDIMSVAAAHISEWKSQTLADLRALAQISKQSGIPILVAVNPVARELAPWDDYLGELELPEPYQRADYTGSEQALATVVAESGLPMIDLRPLMLSEEFRPGHQPMYNSYYNHYDVYGRKFVGAEIARELARRAWWERRSAR